MPLSCRWAWEVIGLASAALGTDNLGANSVLGTSASLLYQLPAGLTVACAVRVGNLVGAQYPYAARTSAKTAMTMSTVIGFFNMGLLILLRKRWGRLFSSDEKVVAIVADVIPLVGVFQVTDCITGAAMGVLRGTGLAVRDAHSPYSSLARSSWLIYLSELQTLGAQINLVAYWVIGIRECLLILGDERANIRLNLLIALCMQPSGSLSPSRGCTGSYTASGRASPSP